MSINLPAVIQSLGGLLQPVQAPPLVNYDPGLVKKFVICLSKDLPSEELQLLQYYGRTISYDHDICNNIDLSTIDFSYFLLDLREANDRTYFQKIITPNIQMFHLILYKYEFQGDNGISFDVERSELPKKQMNSNIFNGLLLQSEIQKPNCLFSLMKALVCNSENKK